MTIPTPITIAYGDGSGPEIMEAALYIVKEAGALLTIETIEIGERIYNMGGLCGILPSAWDSLCRTKILLKAPVATAPFENRTSVNDALLAAFSMYDYRFHDQDNYFASVSKIGADFALFEPMHNTFPKLAGKNTANPSGMIHASVMMLEHIGQRTMADTIRNAYTLTIQDGILTPDRYKWGAGRKKAGTMEFAEAVVERLVNQPVLQG